jgi:two-component system, NarL family, response regulator DesR
MSSGQPTRVIICDDHEIVREAIKARIAAGRDMEVLGEAVDGEELVRRVAELEPDIAIVGIELPGIDGIEATRRIAATRPKTRVIVFTGHAEPELLALALRAGASGYVLKSAPAADITRAVDAVGSGDTFVDPGLSGSDRELEKLIALTPREREILGLLAEGLRVKQIAERLTLSPATVHTHVRNAIAKLDVDTRTEAVALSVRFSYLGTGPR